jgi:hypothetical protein
MSRRRSFGAVRRLPANRWQARYRGDDGRLHSAPGTFAGRVDAERFLAQMDLERSAAAGSARRPAPFRWRRTSSPVDGVVLHEMDLQPLRHLRHVQLAGSYREDEGFGGVYVATHVVAVKQAEGPCR